MSSSSSSNATPRRYEGFDPRFKPRLESLRCLMCLFPVSATHESRSMSSVCVWCANERADRPEFWCERGGHRHRLNYDNYNQNDNVWDCGLCFNYAFGIEDTPGFLNSGAPGTSASASEGSDDGAMRDGKGARAPQTSKPS